MAVLHIAQNMRHWDRREIFETRWLQDEELLADDCMKELVVGGVGWVGWLGGEPVACGGATPIHPGVVNMWMFGTDKFDSIALPLTKVVKRRIMPLLVESGTHRMQCLSMANHSQAHDWLRMLGFVEEAKLRNHGRNKEDFHLFAYTTP